MRSIACILLLVVLAAEANPQGSLRDRLRDAIQSARSNGDVCDRTGRNPEIRKEMMKNLATQICSEDQNTCQRITQCRENQDECRQKIQACGSQLRESIRQEIASNIQDGNIRDAIKQRREAAKTDLQTCATELGFTNIDISQFPEIQLPEGRPIEVIQYIRGLCLDPPQIMEDVGITQDQLVPIIKCMAQNKQKLQEFITCLRE